MSAPTGHAFKDLVDVAGRRCTEKSRGEREPFAELNRRVIDNVVDAG